MAPGGLLVFLYTVGRVDVALKNMVGDYGGGGLIVGLSDFSGLPRVIIL